MVNLLMFYDSHLRLQSRKYQEFTSIYDSRVVIYACAGFIGHSCTVILCPNEECSVDLPNGQ